jgi:segregation and condensation protein B
MDADINYKWDLNEDEFSLELDFYDEKAQEDKLWKARTGLDDDTLCGAIETLIFMSDRPLPIAKIRVQIDPDLPLRVLYEAISRLQDEYEAKHHGIRLMEVAEGYQFRTKPTYSKFVQDLFKVNSLQLSPSTLEVLSIIAYKQPISKTEVDSIRGVDSSHLVRGLMDKRLVRVTGRSEEMGRPSLYGTTPEFLEVFNLADISELPSESELREIVEDNAVGDVSEIKNIVGGDKSKFNFDELVELDIISDSIKEISSDTDFLKLIKKEDNKKKSADAEDAKSAFDILEDFIQNNEIAEQNKAAGNSELLAPALDARIISPKELAGMKPLNAPELEEPMQSVDPTEDVDADFAEIDLAVDEAFDRLTAPKTVEESEADLEQKQADALEAAADLGLDLNFLHTESEDSPSQQERDIE